MENPHGHPTSEHSLLSRWWDMILQWGMGESIFRALLGLTAFAALFLSTLFLQNFYHRVIQARTAEQQKQVVQLQQQASLSLPPLLTQQSARGLVRQTSLHTIIPNRPRQEVVKYVVQPGDTVFGIAEKFGLKPQTILWANYYTLLDNPHSLRPGQELNILPVDGTYYQWQEGDGLNGVARFFGVKPEDIINFPANHLDPNTIGDYAHPNIKPGTWLVIPGGRREFVSWSAPIGVTRQNPAIARALGPGACGPVNGGAVGFGTFIWPANKHYLSGYDYSPETNHYGIDIAGNQGEAVYASDAGVIVYAGWNDWGYGNMIIIDHGNGFQTLYAHLSALNVVCGQSVGQGDVIGAIGTTGRSSGPHLHFEIISSSAKVNPWNYLPPP
ncbi:MAG: M23 family metallopeptidase [Chloroflexi bacterium]|nr:M23 family metallopeptidase [Chloroflexota bacterium]